MFNISRLFTKSKVRNVNNFKAYLRNSTTQSHGVAIAAAVRTPIVSNVDYQHNSVWPQLISLAINGVIQRASLPKDFIDALHYINGNSSDYAQNTFQSELLRKDVLHSFFNEDTEAFKKAIDLLKHGQAISIIVTGINTIVNYTNEATERLEMAISKGLYDAEIMPITLRGNKRQIVTLTQDSCKTFEKDATCVATAIALTTNEHAISLNIKPLAWIEELVEPNEIGVENINRTTSIPDIFGFSSIALQLVHLSHNLNPKQFGCIISTENASSSAFLLQNNNTLNCPPLLTLYTKDQCQLCDDLTAELEQNFKNEYLLEKVYIDRKENIRFLRLYRHDIPVLFYNGQFLCMHRLNSNLLRRKIEESKNNF